MDQKRLQDLLSRIQKYPNNVLDRFVLAKMYHENQDWSECEKACQDILHIKPDYLVVHIMLGECLMKLHQYSQARDSLHTAKELAARQNHLGMIPEIEDLLDQIPDYR